jgi:hypothetical protein
MNTSFLPARQSIHLPWRHIDTFAPASPTTMAAIQSADAKGHSAHVGGKLSAAKIPYIRHNLQTEAPAKLPAGSNRYTVVS